VLKLKNTTAVLASAIVLLGLAATFAIELSNTQAKSRADVRNRVTQRATLAAALIDSIFGTVSQTTSTYQHLYGGATVSTATLNAHRQHNAYVAILDSSGNVLATSSGTPASVVRELPSDPAVTYARHGGTYGLGNILTLPHGAALDFAVPFRTAQGVRIYVSGFPPVAIDAFLLADLQKIPGVTGARNFVIDGNGLVLAASHGRYPTGAPFHGPYPRTAVGTFTRDNGAQFYDEIRLADSNWRMVLDSPDGPLYASVSGLDKWLPWLIFVAFAVVALIAFGLIGRVVDAARRTRDANEQLANVNAELETSNAMLAQRASELARSNEELDQFASIASHDLQEPLRKVRTYTEQLTRIEGEHLSEKGLDYLRRANLAAGRMQTLIEDLLRFSRVATHGEEFTEVDLEQVVDEALDDLSEQVESTGAVIHVGALPTITAEGLQMRQLVQNLISNAIKFHMPEVPPEVWIDSVVDGDNVRLTVRDNGIGFDPKYAGRIFRVFERLHGRTEYSGTGIGLALCRKIADRHAGSIIADSEPGHGATFTVTLPLHPPGSPPPFGAGRLHRTEAHV
jgi:signal transduction histidine kinase